MPVIARATKAQDLPTIDVLCQAYVPNQDNFASVLIETALLCITAIDTDKDEVVGFLCLDDVLCMRLGSHSSGGLKWLPSLPAAQLNTGTAYVWVAVWAHDYEIDAANVLLKAAMNMAPSLSRLLLATSDDITFKEPGLASVFNRIAVNREAGAFLYEAARDAILPKMAIRRARVEDHDDMLPVLQAANGLYPALAKLPESSRPEEAFALTRVVSGQDDQNCVFVAHNGSNMVGFMVVTAEVDTSALADAFDLHPFDNFLPADEYEQRYATARHSVHAKKKRALQQKIDAERAKRRHTHQQAQTDPVVAGEEGAQEGGQQEPGEPEAEQQQQPAEPAADDLDNIDFDLASQPTHEEIRQEMLAMFSGAADDVPPNIFAITMLCMASGYEEQAMEFLRHAFDAFPSKDYCVVTLPHDSLEPPLMGNMARVPPIPGSLFPEVLYLFNRNALLDGFDVRMAADADAEGVSMLVAGMPNSTDIQELFREAQRNGSAVVATCQGEVVGLMTISTTVDLDMLQTNFSLSKLIYLPHHPKERHGEVHMYCMNPIFAHRHREFLAGAQRLMRNTCLYYALPPGQSPPDMLDVMIQVPPRHRSVPMGSQAEFALYAFTRRAAFLRKRAVNAQIVVVGASECGLSAVERLLLDPELSFNYITLLAPGGISVGGVACQYTAGIVARMGLEARVSLVDAELVGLDVTQQLIELSDGSQLAYDLLLITSGLQEQTRNRLAEADPEAAGGIVNAIELSADFSVADASVMSKIIVYGDSLDAYHALATLENRGASDKLSFHCLPDETTPAATLLRQTAERVGMALPEPDVNELVSLSSVEGDMRPLAVFRAPGGPEEGMDTPIDLLVGCRPVDASPIIFVCLNDAGIVYDGRVVVDAAFRTNNPNIYAAGSIAKLSRRYGKDVLFEHYNSKEVGQKLAESVVALFHSSQQPEVAPVMRLAKVVGCSVPGGSTFMFAGTPEAMMRPSLEPPPGGRALHTQTERGYFHITLDSTHKMHSIVYLGRAALQVSKLSVLVGLHANYLNNLVARYDAGEVTDFVNALTEPWTELLYHDHFPEFRASLLEAGLVALASGETDVSVEVQEATLEFVRSRLTELPGYSLPSAAS